MKKLIVLLQFSIIATFCIYAQLPDTKIWNTACLMEIREKIMKNDETYLPAYTLPTIILIW